MRALWLVTLTIALCLTAFACTAPQNQAVSVEAPPPARDGVFIHVSHGPEDPHRVLMALRMAELMAADRDVLVYFDITGIEVVLADAPDLEYAQFPSSATQLATLADLGVPVYACPGCLAAAGKAEDDLADGVGVANKDAFFDFTEGRILTIDY